MPDLRRLDPALADRVHDRLGAVVHGELPQDARHVVLDGLLGDRERVGDLLVRLALRDVVEDLDLARRERREDVRRARPVYGELPEYREDARRDRRPAEDLLIDDELPGSNAADRIGELARLAVLVQVRRGAGADGVE